LLQLLTYLLKVLSPRRDVIQGYHLFWLAKVLARQVMDAILVIWISEAEVGQ
jgi:hypothetical protein